MKKAFVISDVHLKTMASPHGEAILLLLKKAQKECELFIILGDLFDLWLGDGDYFKKEYEKLILEFKELRKTCRIIYFEGNHDLHLKRFWQNELGCEVFTGPQLIEFGNLKIWAEHGDEINRSDRDYLFLRWLLRTLPFTLLIYNLPSRISSFIGKRASQASRRYTEKIENKSVEIFRKYVLELSNKTDFDIFLTGHTHVADDFTFEVKSKSRRLLNLGSWFDGPHYLQIYQGQISIISF